MWKLTGLIFFIFTNQARNPKDLVGTTIDIVKTFIQTNAFEVIKKKKKISSMLFS